jgi:hypothetical protein
MQLKPEQTAYVIGVEQNMFFLHNLKLCTIFIALKGYEQIIKHIIGVFSTLVYILQATINIMRYFNGFLCHTV